MSSIALLVVGLLAFLTGYRIYSRFIAEKIYRLDPDFVTPAHEFEDGVDFLPTNRNVLFGHHFTSVAGAAPIVGPARLSRRWRPRSGPGATRARLPARRRPGR